jgi:hypothetical protein
MDSSITTTSYAVFILTAIFTIPAISRLAKRPWRVKSTNEGDGIYEDKDGRATEESMAKYSTKAQFAVIFAASSIGLATSFALAIFATVRRENQFSELSLVQLWMLFAAWVRKQFIPGLEGWLTLEDLHTPAALGYSLGDGCHRQISARSI